MNLTVYDKYAVDQQADGHKVHEHGYRREDFIYHSSHVIPKSGLNAKPLSSNHGYREEPRAGSDPNVQYSYDFWTRQHRAYFASRDVFYVAFPELLFIAELPWPKGRFLGRSF